MAEKKVTKAKKDIKKEPTQTSEEVLAGKKGIKDGVDQEISQNTTQTASEEEVITETETSAEDTAKLAKAGKRSAKVLKEVEEKEEKIERQKEGSAAQTSEEVSAAKKKGPAPKVRNQLERKSKGYRKSAELVDKTKEYTVKEAAELLPRTSFVKFDASVEVHVNLGVDPKQADQNIRASVSLPHGTGKTLRVAVFAPADQHEAAKKAGADIVGEDDFLQQLDKELLDFDILIATPQLMAKLGKYARILGPKGLMPNPKSGTVTTKVADAVKDAKKGKVEFRVDKQSIVHQAVGKVSFTPAQIAENTAVILKAIADAKPASVKSFYIQKISMATTMGPSVRIATTEI